MSEPSPLFRETASTAIFTATDEVLDIFDEAKIFTGSRIGQPRGRAQIVFPKAARVEPYTQFPARQLFSCGAFSYCETAHVPPLSAVGRFCSIARGLDVFGARHPVEWVTHSSLTYDFFPGDGYSVWVGAQRDLMGNAYNPEVPPHLEEAPPVIGHDVWIGQNVQLARGITIGTGSVVAAGSLVTKDVQPYSIVGGAPARLIRMRFKEPIAQRLLASSWWEYHPDILYRFGFKDPEKFLDGFERAKLDDELTLYQPSALTWRSIADAIGTSHFSIDTVLDGNGAQYLFEGWAHPEEFHTFSTGDTSQIEFPASLIRSAKSIEIDLWPPVFRQQSLTIEGIMGGEQWRAFDGVVGSAQTIVIEMPSNVQSVRSSLVLKLYHPDHIKPSAFGHEHDTRDLSVALTKIRILS